MEILALNCGSSSVKYQLFDWNKMEVIARGMVERVTIGDSLLSMKFPVAIPTGKSTSAQITRLQCISLSKFSPIKLTGWLMI